MRPLPAALAAAVTVAGPASAGAGTAAMRSAAGECVVATLTLVLEGRVSDAPGCYRELVKRRKGRMTAEALLFDQAPAAGAA